MAISTAALLFSAAPAALTVGQIIIGGLVFAGASYVVSSALIPKPKIPDLKGSGSAGLSNVIDGIAPFEIVYGQVRKGGIKTYFEDTNSNKYHHVFLTIAGHEVEEIGDIYINDVNVTASGDYTSSTGLVGGDWEGKVKVLKMRGNQTSQSATFQDTSITLANIVAGHDGSSALFSGSGMTASQKSNFIGQGIAFLYIRFEYDRDVFSNGVPVVSAVVKGKKVYDPRTNTTAYSNNAALCIADYLRSYYGLNLTSAEVDYDSVETAADACASTGVLGSQSNEFHCNGVLTTADSPKTNIETLLTANNGSLVWAQGQFAILTGSYRAASSTALTEANLRSNITVKTRTSRRDNFNTVRGTFVDGGEDWIATDFPEQQIPDLADDGSVESVLDLQLAMTTGSATAQRLAKQILYVNREQIVVKADFDMTAFQYRVGDVVPLTLDRYGWSDKPFEIIDWKFNAFNGGDLKVSLTLKEISSTAYEWSVSADEYQIIESNNTSLSDPFTVTGPTNVQAQAVRRVNQDGAVISEIRITWTPSVDSQVIAYEVHTKETHHGTWMSTTVDKDTSLFVIPATNGASYYNYKVRAVSALGRRSGFVPSGGAAILAGYDGTIPSAPTLGTLTGGYRSVIVRWTEPDLNTAVTAQSVIGGIEYEIVSAGSTDWTDFGAADNSVGTTFVAERDGTSSDGTGTAAEPLRDLARYIVYRNTVNNSGTATAVFSTDSTAFTDSGLSSETTYYYWVSALDRSGNEGAKSAGGSAQTLADLKTIVLSASSQVFTFASDNATAAPSSQTITFTANTQGITGNLSFTAVDENGASITLSGTGSTRTMTVSDFDDSETATVQVTGGDISDTVTIHRLAQGGDSVAVILSNETHTFGATAGGSVTDFTGSGTTIRVYVGTAEQTYNGSATNASGLSNGEWFVTKTATNITVGNIVDSGTYATVPDATAITAATGQITYSITGKDGNGQVFTATKVQTFSKALAGDDAKAIQVRADKQLITYDGAGNLAPASQSVSFTAYLSNMTGNATWSVSADGTAIATQDLAEILTITNNTAALVVSGSAGSFDTEGYEVVTVTVTKDGISDSVSIYKISNASNAITGILSNESHVFTADKDGGISDYTGSGSTLRVYQGATELTYNGTATASTDLSNGEWFVSATSASGIAAGSFTDSGTYLTIGAASSMTANGAQVTHTITGKDSIGTAFSFDKIQSFSKSITGATGANAVTVQLTSNHLTVLYDEAGANPSQSSVTLTATAQTVSNGFFKFTGGGSAFTDETTYTDGSGQLTDTATFTLPQTITSDTFYSLRVGVADGNQTELAHDTITITAIKASSSALFAVLSNEAHTLQADNNGAVTSYSGSGTTISVYEGTTQLNHTTGTAAAGQFSVSAAATGITAGAITDSGNNAVVGNHSNMTAEDASVVFTIAGKRQDGTVFSFTRTQSISKSIKGDKGDQGIQGVPAFAKQATYTAGTDTGPESAGEMYFGQSASINTVQTGSVWQSRMYLRINREATAGDIAEELRVSTIQDRTIVFYRDADNYGVYRSDSSASSGYFSGSNYYYMYVDKVNAAGDYSFSATYTVGVSEATRGAGWWRVDAGSTDLSSLTSAQITTYFHTAYGDDTANPVEGDRLIIATTHVSGTKAFIYSSGSWSAQAEFIDGNLMVAGTITAAALNITGLSSIDDDVGTIVAGKLQNASSNPTFVIDLTNSSITISS